MNITAIFGFALIAAIICVVLNQYKPEYRIVIGLLAGAAILFVVFVYAEPIIEEIKELMKMVSSSDEMFTILFKALGICYLTQFASDSCRDAGENGLASKTELAGKILITITALPLFSELIRTVNGLL